MIPGIGFFIRLIKHKSSQSMLRISKAEKWLKSSSLCRFRHCRKSDPSILRTAEAEQNIKPTTCKNKPEAINLNFINCFYDEKLLPHVTFWSQMVFTSPESLIKLASSKNIGLSKLSRFPAKIVRCTQFLRQEIVTSVNWMDF